MDKSRFLVFLQLRNIPLRRILPPVLVDLGPKIPLKDDISLQQLQKTFLKISYRYPALITGRIYFKLTLQMNLIGKNVDKILLFLETFSLFCPQNIAKICWNPDEKTPYMRCTHFIITSERFIESGRTTPRWKAI